MTFSRQASAASKTLLCASEIVLTEGRDDVQRENQMERIDGGHAATNGKEESGKEPDW